MELNNTISAIVTGGASGLGAGTALALSQKGVRVALFDLNESKGEKIAKEINGLFCKVDVSNPESVLNGFKHARKKHGQEAVLVNCAGIVIGQKIASHSRSTGEIRTHNIKDFQNVIQVNLIGSFICAAQSAAGMMTSPPLNEDGEKGLIINTSSVAAMEGQIGQLAYAASKGGILGMTLPIARDLASEGIRAMTILPGFLETPIYDSLKPEIKENLKKQTLFPKRFGTSKEFGQLVISICENIYLNGESISSRFRVSHASKIKLVFLNTKIEI